LRSVFEKLFVFGTPGKSYTGSSITANPHLITPFPQVSPNLQAGIPWKNCEASSSTVRIIITTQVIHAMVLKVRVFR